MSPRLATALVFVVNGAMIGTWIAQIPWIAGQLDATKTEVGLALLCTSMGAIVSMTLTGQLLTHISSRHLVTLFVLLFPLLAPLPTLAPSLAVLALVLLAFGLTNGVLDVSMNAHGVALERVLGRPIISSLHAGWSIGVLLGASGVALAAGTGVDPRLETVVVAAVLLGLGAVAIPSLGQGSEPSERLEGAARISLPSRAVLPLGLLAVLAAIVEGGIGDWAGLYLERDLGLDAGPAALGFAAFALGMTGARLAGDALNRRFGPAGLLQVGMAVTAIALALFLIVGQPVVALLGLVVAGVGVANAIPVLFSAGGHIPPPGPSLAAVFTMSYAAFLAGPPIIGFVADRIGLPTTMGLLVAVAAVAAVVAPRVPGIDASANLPGHPVAEPG
jgi:hypothetical protein